MNKFLIVGFYSKFQTNLIMNVFENYNKNNMGIWINKKENFKLIKERFEKVELLDYHDCIRGINDFNLEDKKSSTKALIKFSKKYLETFLKMYERFDPIIQYDKKYKQNHFHFLLKNWVNKISKEKINTALFFANPHTLFDYSIYIVCKFLNIKIIIQEDTKYFSTIFFTKSIGDLSKAGKDFKKMINKKNSHKIKKLISNYKIFSVQKYLGDMEFLSELNFKKDQASLIRILYWAFLKPFIKYRLNFLKVYEYFFKKQNSAIWNYTKKPYYLKSSLPTKFEDQFYYIQKYFKLSSLKKKLKINTSEPDLKKDYVVFYDSISPEKSQIPDAKNFYDTLKVLKLIRRILPPGWRIYYKEHPAAFSMQFETHLSKSKDFYSDLKKIKNLSIIDLNFKKKDLLKKSKFTITTTGEIGMQSVINNVPTLNLGNAWYSSCPGVVHVENLSDLKKAINKISKIKKINIKNIYYFLNGLVNLGIDLSYKNQNLQWTNFENFKKDKNFQKFFTKIIKNYRKKLPV